MERRLAAVMLTDVVGYSRLVGLDEEGTIMRVKAHRRDCFDPAIASHGGRVVKSIGDGLLVEFPSVVDAVNCAIEVQNILTGESVDLPDEQRIEYRIGINLGDVIVDGDDILGDGVNVAARLEGLSEPGGLCISGAVHAQVNGKVPAEFRDLGRQNVKNIAEPVRAYALKSSNMMSETSIATTTPKRSSIAVLPFANMSADPEQEYFADGITEDLITALSNVKTFNVLARNSTFAYKGKSVDARRIGTELDANYMIEGSVRRSGDRLRVTAQLIDTETGDHLWANRYDGTLQDIFDLQDELTSTIVATIEPELVRAEGLRLQTKPPETMVAYDHLLRGVAYMHKLTPEDTRKALASFERAIELDPKYGRAYAFASWCYRRDVQQSGLASLSEEEKRIAIKYAREAVRHDRNDPFVLAYAASTLGPVGAEFDEALALVDRALSLHPNSHRFWNGKAIIHLERGDTKDAISAAERAISLGPNDPAIWVAYGCIALGRLLEQNFDEALDFARRSTRHNENFGPGYYTIAAAAAHLGRLDEAKEALDIALTINPGMTLEAFPRHYQIAKLERPEIYLEGLRLAGLPEE